MWEKIHLQNKQLFLGNQINLPIIDKEEKGKISMKNLLKMFLN